MIRFEHVFKRYDDEHEALKGVNCFIDQGEMVFLTGHSGAGKSTFLKLIMCMERPTQGLLMVGDKNLGRLPHSQIPYYRRNMGVVFQNHQLLNDRTIFDNVALPLSISGYTPAEIGKRVRAALDKVGLLHKEKQYPMQLSGGEQQRVGIARAVVNKPAILLADEPTGNLDPELSSEIMNLFEQFNRVGVTVLIASHDLALVAKMRHRVLTLQGGRMLNDGAPA